MNNTRIEYQDHNKIKKRERHMRLDANEVISRYKKYGFEYKEKYSNEDYLTFTFKSGFFHNAEIVKITNKETKQVSEIRESLKKLGYSEKIAEYSNLNDIETGLFNGFFDVENWKKRIKDEYNQYINSIINIYPNNDSLKYEYINSPYSILTEKETPNNSIIENIIEKLNSEKSQLILIEAPAGFGKTSTSYELLHKLSLDNSKPMPFFTEFSRDRQAKIFSHVFVREVDRTFSQVNSTLVADELKNGRILMILDGFDELLSDTSQQSDTHNTYENAEPMLETIGDLLSNKAKIIITSRRSAMFDEYLFKEWLDRFTDKFEFIRYRIEPPQIENWLNSDRRAKLAEIDISISQMANPVLLSYLRFLNNEKFDELCANSNEIVEHYFTSMLEREQERQNLLMQPNKQEILLTSLAADMCKNDYTSDSKENIISFFKNNCLYILEETRKLYKPSDRPSLDSLCNTLSNHAFFNRSNQDDSRLEFINEFVFGNYIANDILQTKNDWIASDERFVEPAVISYLPRTLENKKLLWNSLESMLAFLDISERMKYEFSLLNNIKWKCYENESISSISIYNIHAFFNENLSEMAFYNCNFNKVTFYLENIEKITFINCRFYDCNSIGINRNILFLNSIDNNEFISLIENNDEEQEIQENDTIAHLILSKFWKIGSDNIERKHIPLVSIFKSCTQKYERDEVIIKIKSLKRKGILSDANDGGYIALNTDKVSEIRKILGK
ncbi:hypothetical protein C2818_02710 [Pasteurella multocida]|nr:hypothetical protein [Pasteurella multocida]